MAKKQIKIPRCMSTQHPDNVILPFFAHHQELGGDDEIEEAYYTYSHMGMDEQMWDCEGKEVDNYVVKKLLTHYESYFRNKKLGEDIFLTLRVPNPKIEKAEAKILLETLESIPRSFDAAKLFYKEDIAPIFEVILPMTSSSESIDRIHKYYSKWVVGKQNTPIKEGDITIADWIGEFKPKNINVIPLFEDKENMLNADKITREYMKDKTLEYQRVFLARSDPAMNYGVISAVLLNKIALYKLQKLEEETKIKIYPIIGVGSVPFRGNLKPSTAVRVMKEYPSVQTFTIQSSFKYDNPPEEVIEAIKKMRKTKTGKALKIDENKALEIIERYAEEFKKQIMQLAPVINEISIYIPKRRKRKLHIGLFGYSRSVGGISLPRVITLTAAMYSMGIPPEILGLNALTKEDIKFIKKCYINFDSDMADALKYYNEDNKLIPFELKTKIKELGIKYQTDQAHKEITTNIIKSIENKNFNNLGEQVLRAAYIRRFLG